MKGVMYIARNESQPKLPRTPCGSQAAVWTNPVTELTSGICSIKLTKLVRNGKVVPVLN
jgi:hypothetical protein